MSEFKPNDTSSSNEEEDENNNNIVNKQKQNGPSSAKSNAMSGLTEVNENPSQNKIIDNQLLLSNYIYFYALKNFQYFYYL